MNGSDCLNAGHLARRALIYIRQSRPHQVLTNQESLRLQYALRQRAQALGWQAEQIDVIDADLGLSGVAVQHREGFKEVLARVGLGQVGILLSIEVTRLSRNCSDWYPLLDLCRYKGCLIADQDGVYDPASINGRLLLGFKGQISELELHTLHTRLTAGLINKAQRGELALSLPTGLVRDPSGIVQKDPNREVQGRISLIFSTFLERGSASKVLRSLNEQALTIPRRDRFGDIVWKRPTIAAILFVLKNPAYAGAFVYGRTRTTHPEPGRTVQKSLPIEQWRIVVKDKYPAYISWPTYERIQTQLRDNYAEYDRNKSRGVPRPGSALLHGLVYCGECGHKMVVQYKGGSRYLCNYLRGQHQVPVCQYLPADPIDTQVVQAFFAALSPVELDLYARAVSANRRSVQAIDQARRQQLERLRYQEALARRQFLHVDPDNRLVASELEHQWEVALRQLQEAENAYAQEQAGGESSAELPADLKAAFQDIGQRLPQLWSTDTLTDPQRKALLRCLIDKVVVQRQGRDRIHTRIVWKGGESTSLEIPIAVGSLAELTDHRALEKRIVELTAARQTDRAIAEQLSGEGYRSPQKDHLLPSTVQTIRLRHRLLRDRHQSHPRQIPGYLTVAQIAAALAVSRHWIYDRIHNGCIRIRRDRATNLYLFPDRSDTLEQFKALRMGAVAYLDFTRGHPNDDTDPR